MKLCPRRSLPLGLGLAVALAASPLFAATIEISTDEGTWISLDASPDGETLVFELLGDLFVLPVEGGIARPLITGRAFQSQPRFSPDGLAVVYVSDGGGSDNVWVADADGGNPRAVTDLPRAIVLSPAWSPDGRSVYATVISDTGPRAAEIWRYHLATGAGERVVANANGRPSPLVSTPAPGAYGPAPTPDGRALLYTSVTPRPYGSRDGPRAEILRHDLETGRAETLSLGATMAMRPGLTRDGRTLIYGAVANGKTGLRARDVESEKERWLAFPIQRHQLEGRATRDVLPGFAVAADGSAVFAAFGGKIRRLPLLQPSTFRAPVVPFTADVALEVEPRLESSHPLEDGPVRARRFRHLAVAADGRLAFSTLFRIWVAAPDGSTPRRLTRSEQTRELMPAWSPDGQWIAYVTSGREGGHLWKARADGSGDPVRLSAEPALWVDPVWSPSGDAILALRTSLGTGPASGGPGRALTAEAELVSAPAAAGPLRVLAAADGLRRPHFAAARDADAPGAESRIYLSSPQGLVSFDLDGDDRRSEATLPDGARGAATLLSPQGDEILAPTRGSLLRWSRPESGAALTIESAEVLSERPPSAFAWAGERGPVWIVGRQLARAGAQTTTLDVAVPSAKPSGTVILRGARVITMATDPATEIVDEADVVVTGNRIAYVGARDDSRVPEGARILDVSGKVIVPGFVDVHAHFFPSDDLPQPDAPWAFANLALGVTTLRNPQAPADVFGLADGIAADGLPAPRLFSTGPGIELGFRGGHYLAPPFASIGEVQRSLAPYRDEYGTHLLKSYLVGDRQERQWVVQAARELGMRVTTEGGADTKANLTQAIDGFTGNEHALPVAPIYDDVVQLIAKTGITYTPTLVVSFGAALPIYRLLADERPHESPLVARWHPEGALYAATSERVLWFPRESYHDREVAAGAAAILEAGGRVAVGGHGEVQGLAMHWEMELLATGGTKPLDVLRAATIHGAETLGLDHDLGSLEAGKLADLVVLDRDPLADIRNTRSVHRVMKNGVLYDAATLDELWPKERIFELPWWLDESSFSLEARIDRHLRRRMREARIPCLAVAVVDGGEVLLAKGYGKAELENDVVATAETLFQSGSIGKMFTAAGILALVEDGRIELDASVLDYLEDGPEKWRPITVRHLLTHSSGIPDYTGESFDYRSSYSDERLVAMASELELEFPAGSRFNYSNTGYVMLGILTTRVTGKPYWQFLRERIYDPAGMPTIRVIDEPSILRHRARGYVPVDGGWQHAGWVSPELNSTADGAMLMSLHDMVAWNEAVRTRSVLQPESWQLAQTAMTLTSGNRYPYGFGWAVDEVAGRRRRGHGGAWQGFTAMYNTYPDDDLAVIVLSNASTGATGAIADEVAALIEPELAPEPPATQAIPDPDPEATRTVSRMLAKAARSELELSDFDFLRQTSFPGITRFLARTLDGLDAPDRLELLAREEIGDDRALQYYAWYGDRRFRVFARLGPGGGLTGLGAREEPLAEKPEGSP